MSIGNTKDLGNKGNNFPYQRSVLELLSALVAMPPPVGGATEVTLAAVLASLQNGKEFEQSLVIDTGGVGTPTYLQVRIFDTDTSVFNAPIYYNASGALVVPVGPLELVNPQLVLNNILTQVTSLNSKFTGVTRTPSLLRVSGAGVASIAAGARSVSVYNAGITDGSWLGATIRQGESLSYNAGGEDDVLAAFAYDALTTELVITTVI